VKRERAVVNIGDLRLGRNWWDSANDALQDPIALIICVNL
jgi:hypothetical protein